MPSETSMKEAEAICQSDCAPDVIAKVAQALDDAFNEGREAERAWRLFDQARLTPHTERMKNAQH